MMKPDDSTGVNIKAPCGGEAQHEKRHGGMVCDCGCVSEAANVG